jgi:hypothetical protein
MLYGLPDQSQKLPLLTMDKKVIARQCILGKCSRVRPPGSKRIWTDQRVCLSPKGGDWAGKDVTCYISEGPAQGKIRLKKRLPPQDHVFVWQTAQPTDVIQQRVSIIDVRTIMSDVWCQAGGHKQVIRNQVIAVVQLASDLETQQRSKAMAEQGERLLSICMDYLRQILGEQRKVTQERFILSRSVTRQFHSTYFYLRRQDTSSGPAAIHRSAAAYIWETEQAYGCSRIGLMVYQPRVLNAQTHVFSLSPLCLSL